jgi:hypothetical protein
MGVPEMENARFKTKPIRPVAKSPMAHDIESRGGRGGLSQNQLAPIAKETPTPPISIVMLM